MTEVRFIGETLDSPNDGTRVGPSGKAEPAAARERTAAGADRQAGSTAPEKRKATSGHLRTDELALA